MLEPVVEDDRVGPEAGARETRGLDATLARHDRAREPMREHTRLLAAPGRRAEGLPPLADHDYAATALAVAAGDDPRPPAAGGEARGEPERRRRLPAAADDEVADAQHPRRHASRREPAGVVQPVPERHDGPVDDGGGRERGAESAVAGRATVPDPVGERLESARRERHPAACAKLAMVRRAAMILRCRSSAPCPVSTSARARRPMSASRSGASRSPLIAIASVSAELTRRAAPPATRRSTTSAAFSVCGPTRIGRPARAGSITLCPPAGTRLPPTKASTPSP